MLWRSVPFYASEIEDRKAYCFCPVCIQSFCPPLWNLNLANNFWTVRARALIFHMNISCDKTFPWGALFFTLWPWPWSLTHFLKPLTLLMTFQQWVLELWYFTWIFPVIRTFLGYHYFLPCDLDLPWSLTHFLKTLTLQITFKQWVLELCYLTWIFPVIRPFRGYH